MFNKAMPAIPIMLDKERALLLNFRAIVAFEKVTGQDVLKNDLTNMDSAKVLRALLWACLLHEDNSLTLKEAGKLNYGANLGELKDKLNQAWFSTMPDLTPEAEYPLARSRPRG